jgi:hypothetical protein
MRKPTSIPTKPERKGFKPVRLTGLEIDDICRAWGDYKYTKVFKLIANNPAMLTHEVASLVPCNNVPDQAAHANERLINRGLALLPMEPANLPRTGNSWHWFLCEVPTVSANDDE